MRFRYLLLVLAGTTSADNMGIFKQELPLLNTLDTCDCTGTNDTGNSGVTYICHDPRLGPARLPKTFPLLSFVSDYDRFGGQTPGAFLKQWTFPENGSYRYPPDDGFQLDSACRPILGNMTLHKGTKLDRFGSEGGKFVSAADAPFSQRSLPPSSLDTLKGSEDYPYGYHIYNVVKSFEVEGGPIAPWFGQPGLGAQFYVGATGRIFELLNKGYLERVDKDSIRPGPGKGGDCGL